MNNKTKILIVEDSSTQALKLKHLLEQEGYEADVVGTGEEAIDYLARQKPSLVVSDVVMPEMSGFELCRRIKKDAELKSIPVILLTTLSQPGDIIEGLKSGADNFITKPYDDEFLISRIEYILINQEIRQRVMTEIAFEIYFAGQKHHFTAEKFQIIDLLLSTYDAILQRNKELQAKTKEVKKLDEFIETMADLLKSCMQCEKFRNDADFQKRFEKITQAYPKLSAMKKLVEVNEAKYN